MSGAKRSSKSFADVSNMSVIRIQPYHYIHVLDNNSNVTRVEIGPRLFTRQDHEKVVCAPTSMVVVPDRHYIMVSNPARRTADGEVSLCGARRAAGVRRCPRAAAAQRRQKRPRPQRPRPHAPADSAGDISPCSSWCFIL